MRVVNSEEALAQRFKGHESGDELGWLHFKSCWAVQAVVDGVMGLNTAVLPGQHPAAFQGVDGPQMGEHFFKEGSADFQGFHLN